MDTTLHKPRVVNNIKNIFELIIGQINQTRTQFSWQFTKVIESQTIRVRKEKEIEACCVVGQIVEKET